MLRQMCCGLEKVIGDGIRIIDTIRGEPLRRRAKHSIGTV
jgi:hypothetical protein